MPDAEILSVEGGTVAVAGGETDLEELEMVMSPPVRVHKGSSKAVMSMHLPVDGHELGTKGIESEVGTPGLWSAEF